MVETSELFLAIILLLLGAAVLYVLLAPLFRTVFTLIRDYRLQAQRRRFHRDMEAIDLLMKESRFAEATRLLQHSLAIDTYYHPGEIKAALDHNQNLLSRLLLIADARNIRLHDMAAVERHLEEYAGLQLSLIRSKESLQRIKGGRLAKGKSMPDWTTNDFRNKRRALRTALRNARRDLEQALYSLFSQLLAKEVDVEAVTIH